MSRLTGIDHLAEGLQKLEDHMPSAISFHKHTHSPPRETTTDRQTRTAVPAVVEESDAPP